ncbi:MAG: hypothetical protein ACI9F9_001853, partial [Candidatus Paceibacteria bacterium]
MASKRKTPTDPLFDQVVFAPDRDSIPGTRVVVSWDESDEPDYVKSVDEVALRKVRLSRRGKDHGVWAELDLTASGVDPLRAGLDTALAKDRWKAAQPIVLPGLLQEIPEAERAAGLALGLRL